VSRPSLQALLAKPLVRVACGLVGAGIVATSVWATGARAVASGLGRSAHALPAMVGLEAAILVCNTLSLRALYGADAGRVSLRQWVKAGTLGYAVGSVLPLSRAAAEASRAVLLRQSVGGPHAAVAAVEMQGVALLANAILSACAFGATLAVLGTGGIATLILTNGVLAAILGTSILLVRRSGHPGRILNLLGKARGHEFGAAFDAAPGASRRGLLSAVAWESGSRALQVYQCGIALAAVGQPSGLLRTLVSRGMLLLGGALGDFIPGQLGGTEATMALAATALGLGASATALALLIHGAQLLLALACTGLYAVIPRVPPLPSELEIGS
jgi:Lysylphosphatidylglycerol synthase TM region